MILSLYFLDLTQKIINYDLKFFLIFWKKTNNFFIYKDGIKPGGLRSKLYQAYIKYRRPVQVYALGVNFIKPTSSIGDQYSYMP